MEQPQEIQKALSAFAEQLRAARFDDLSVVANGPVADTWIEDGRMKYWPGGSFDNWFRKLSPRENDVVGEFCGEYGWEIVGVGTGRVVIAPQDDGVEWVVKVGRYGPSARHGDGVAQNQLEKQRWGTVRSYPFMPIIAAGKRCEWLVMLSANTGEKGESFDDEILEELRTKATAHIDDIPPEDILPQNVGVRDGRWWIVDYGQPTLEGQQLYGLLTCCS